MDEAARRPDFPCIREDVVKCVTSREIVGEDDLRVDGVVDLLDAPKAQGAFTQSRQRKGGNDHDPHA